MTPKHLLLFGRTAFAGAVLAAAALLFGPFAGVESAAGLTDKEAHLLGFYGLSLLTYFAFPRRRRNDLAVMLVMLAGATELVQAGIGRDGDIWDWAADAAGIGLTVAPTFVEQLRKAVREAPHLPLRRALALADRRRKAAAPQPHPSSPPAAAAR